MRFIISIVLILFINLIAIKADEGCDSLTKFINNLIESKEEFLTYLDTNQIVDATEFISILKSDNRIMQTFKNNLIDIHQNKFDYGCMSLKYCNADTKCYFTDFLLNNDTASEIRLMHFILNENASTKKFTFEFFNYFLFQSAKYKKDYDNCRNEINKLIDIQFDFNLYHQQGGKLQTDFYVNENKKSAFYSATLDTLRSFTNTTKGQITAINNDLDLLNGKDSFFPVFDIYVKFQDTLFIVKIIKDDDLFDDSKDKYILKSIWIPDY